MAQKLNNRLNYQPSGENAEDEEENAGQATEESYQKFEEELEINDFPQLARWRVTSKEALAQISEYSEAGITVRGTFCSAVSLTIIKIFALVCRQLQKHCFKALLICFGRRYFL